MAAIGLPVALLSGSLAGAAQAKASAPTSNLAAAVAAAPCPAPVPLAQVRAGMVGQGLTVVRGRTPQPFKVEVLGVLKDGIGAGHDMILIKISDLAGQHVVDQGGGIWAGMSGSPVYVGGKLLGAVSYGFTLAPSPIGGLTPAADMMHLLKTSTSGTTKAQPEPAVVPLSKTVRAQLAARAQAAAPRGALRRLTMPLSLSGLSGQRLDQLQSQADRAHLPVVAYAGSSHSAARAGTMTTPHPGGNFAAAMSYGDVSAAAVGTTTAVCGGRAVAFGHPFNLAGATTYGANDADSKTIVKDNTLGSFKMASIEEPFGTVDQDRTTGIGAKLGLAPGTIPVTVTVHNLDSRRARTGTTRVTDADVLPGLAPYAVLADFDSAFDEVGDGRASSTWTITGTRAGGKPFNYTRTNRWAARDDVAFPPALDVANALDALVNNEFEPVHIKRVDFNSNVATTYRQLRITKVAVSVDGKRFVTADSVRLKAGATVKVRVTMLPFRSSVSHTETLTVKVPKKTGGRSGTLLVSGGLTLADFGDEQGSDCLLFDGGCDPVEAKSLTALMKSITSAPRNDDVVATLSLDPRGDSGKPTVRSDQAGQQAVVSGSQEIAVEVRR